MIQKEGMDLLPNLLFQSLQIFKMSIDLGLIHSKINDKKGWGVVVLCRYRSVSILFLIGCLNYVIQTHINDNVQAIV